MAVNEDDSSKFLSIVEEVFENERKTVVSASWSHKHLMVTDPNHFEDSKGKPVAFIPHIEKVNNKESKDHNGGKGKEKEKTTGSSSHLKRNHSEKQQHHSDKSKEKGKSKHGDCGSQDDADKPKPKGERKKRKSKAKIESRENESIGAGEGEEEGEEEEAGKKEVPRNSDALGGGWKWADKWQVDITYFEKHDKEGWTYAIDFPFLEKSSDFKFSKDAEIEEKRHAKDKKKITNFVRRRRWIRTRVQTDEPPKAAKKPHTRSLKKKMDKFFPFSKEPADPKTLHTYSNVDANTFNVRSKSYLRSSYKKPSKASIFELVNIDVVHHGKHKWRHVATHQESYYQRALAAGDERYKFILNFMFPPVAMICTFAVNPEPVAKNKVFAPLWRKFVDGTDDFRNSRFKLIPRVMHGPWILKKSVGTKPCLLGNKLDIAYMSEKNYFELDCDVYSSKIASVLCSMILNQAKHFSIDLAFVLQGNDREELPEVIMAALRLCRPDLQGAREITIEHPKKKS